MLAAVKDLKRKYNLIKLKVNDYELIRGWKWEMKTDTLFIIQQVMTNFGFWVKNRDCTLTINLSSLDLAVISSTIYSFTPYNVTPLAGLNSFMFQALTAKSRSQGNLVCMFKWLIGIYFVHVIVCTTHWGVLLIVLNLLQCFSFSLMLYITLKLLVENQCINQLKSCINVNQCIN